MFFLFFFPLVVLTSSMLTEALGDLVGRGTALMFHNVFSTPRSYHLAHRLSAPCFESHSDITTARPYQTVMLTYSQWEARGNAEKKHRFLLDEQNKMAVQMGPVHTNPGRLGSIRELACVGTYYLKYTTLYNLTVLEKTTTDKSSILSNGSIF